MATADLAHLISLAREFRVQIIRMLTHAGSGHPGGSLSAIDLLTALYFGGFLRYDPKNPWWPERDRFILSKGHCVPALYVVLGQIGYISEGELLTLRKVGSRFQGHPYPGQPGERFPGIEAATGSLGQGLSIAIGMALAVRMDGRPSRVFCMLGDGECQAGQVWEAAMSAPRIGGGRYRLDNLCAIVDRNRIQNDDFVDKTLPLDPFAAKWEAFGWHVIEVGDGHDMGAIVKGLQSALEVTERPVVLIAHTVKGKGVSFMENNPKWHGVAPKPAEGIQSIREILGVREGDWLDYLRRTPKVAAIVEELQALETK
ncbi:MAG: transketolase [Candidatus Rokubacteria bacterium]|nr:transketolase [Candidatus Rokubacteria bacterium]MBI2553852.1 transketolase [Candidatus Rokubacteria bacterium]